MRPVFNRAKADPKRSLLDIIGLREGVKTPAAINMLITSHGPLFFCDTDINENPTAEQIADITLLAAEEVGRFTLPKVARLSYGVFQDNY